MIGMVTNINRAIGMEDGRKGIRVNGTPKVMLTNVTFCEALALSPLNS